MGKLLDTERVDSISPSVSDGSLTISLVTETHIRRRESDLKWFQCRSHSNIPSGPDVDDTPTFQEK